MTTINGYTFDETKWETRGGTSQCLIATKGNKKYFLKRLNRPKYPTASFTGAFRTQKIAECDRWLRARKRIIAAIPGEGTGNIVKPIEYFRDGSVFFEVAHCISIDQIPFTDLYKLPVQDRACVMMTVASSLRELHSAGIVHGDLDPSNILISRSAKGMLITKLIDFTDSFFAKDPPKSIVSKEAWWSPEVALYNKAAMAGQAPNRYKEFISCKADVFSLGLIFHQYCTKGGVFPKHKGDYPCQGLFGGGKLTIAKSIEPCFQDLIEKMLQPSPSDRPSMAEVHQICQEIWKGESVEQKKDDKPEPPVRKDRKQEADSSRQKEQMTPHPAEKAQHINPAINDTGPAYKPGRVKIGGVSVKSVQTINEKKVKVYLCDGTHRVYDTPFALALGYISA